MYRASHDTSFHCLIPRSNRVSDLNCPQRGRASHARHCLIPRKKTRSVFLQPPKGAAFLEHCAVTTRCMLKLSTNHYSLFTIHYSLTTTHPEGHLWL